MNATSIVAIKNQHFSSFFLPSSCHFQPETAAVGFESTLLGFVNDGFANCATVLAQNLLLYC
jgi:hypothetical protein